MTTTKRKVRDEADARACLGDIERSGLRLRAWANAHGVDGRSLQAWVMTFQRRERSSPRFVELVAKPEGDARYVVRVGAFTVVVDERFDDVTLQRLLAACATVAAC